MAATSWWWAALKAGPRRCWPSWWASLPSCRWRVRGAGHVRQNREPARRDAHLPEAAAGATGYRRRAIVLGRIDVALPDNHLLLRPGHVQVVRRPKENGFRPAVDPLDGGTAGLLSIKARGGSAPVQDLDEAAVPEMPQSALQHVDLVTLCREGGDRAASGGGDRRLSLSGEP